MKRLIFLVSVGVFLALLFRHFCFEVIYIASESMEPTLKFEEQVIINKTAYFFRKPLKGDMVLLRSPVKKDMIKRIIGLPGEELLIRRKKVFIDDEPFEEDYTQYTRAEEMLVGDNMGPLIIPAESYFMMGDNRDVSRDSRDWFDEDGLQTIPVKLKDIKGKVVSLY